MKAKQVSTVAPTFAALLMATPTANNPTMKVVMPLNQTALRAWLLSKQQEKQ